MEPKRPFPSQKHTGTGGGRSPSRFAPKQSTISGPGSQNPAALKAKIKIKNKTHPRIRAGIGQQTQDFLEKIAIRTLPRDPPGEGGPRIKSKLFLSTASKIRSKRTSGPATSTLTMTLLATAARPGRKTWQPVKAYCTEGCYPMLLTGACGTEIGLPGRMSAGF